MSQTEALARLIDRSQIEDAMRVYARGVDRGDWALVRAAYHGDAYDDHGDYKGPIDGLIAWLEQRFAGVDNSMHFLGNCLIEFAAPDRALVETYFVSHRLRALTDDERKTMGPRDAMSRQAWGRYVDRFERRDSGPWLVARRIVVLEAAFSTPAIGGQRGGPAVWGRRDGSDRLYEVQAEIFGASSRSG
jgi:hypothetical protein